ncbi:hypothetical protein CRYUN_Cryun14cG0040400 [Craigia yunnanensis]
MVNALVFALDMGFAKVGIEGDALSVIKNMQSKEPDFSGIGNTVEEGKCFSSLFNSICFKHTGRAGNEAANYLSKYGLKFLS